MLVISDVAYWKTCIFGCNGIEVTYMVGSGFDGA